MNEPSSCPVCLSGENVSWLLEKNDWRLHRCASCDHIFVDPQPTPEQIAALYSFQDGYQVQGMQRFEATTAFPPKLVRSLDQIRGRLTSGRLLDVGCSNGSLLHLARRAGFEVHGVELNPGTAAIARANGLDVFVGSLGEAGFTPESFDVIHLGDLIEHVSDAGRLLVEVRGLLRPGGTLLVLTPNHDAFFPRATFRLFTAFGIPWSHPTPPHHLNQFSRRSLTRLLRRAGFRVVEEHYAPCSLAYELRATGLLGRLKRRISERRFVGAATAAAYASAAFCLYTAIWLVDRLLPRKRTDFAMTFLAAPCSVEPVSARAEPR